MNALNNAFIIITNLNSSNESPSLGDRLLAFLLPSGDHESGGQADTDSEKECCHGLRYRCREHREVVRLTGVHDYANPSLAPSGKRSTVRYGRRWLMSVAKPTIIL